MDKTKEATEHQGKAYRDYSRSPSRGHVAKGSYRRESHSRSPRNRSSTFGRDPDEPRPSKCLGVFGLDFSATRRDLDKMFSRYGELDDVYIVMDNYTGKSRGFGFVYFRHLKDAIEAKEDAHGRKLCGNTIRTDYSLTSKPHSPTPGRYLGRSFDYNSCSGSHRYGSRDYSSRRRARYSRSRS